MCRSVKTFKAMAEDCTEFNVDISGWDVRRTPAVCTPAAACDTSASDTVQLRITSAAQHLVGLSAFGTFLPWDRRPEPRSFAASDLSRPLEFDAGVATESCRDG